MKENDKFKQLIDMKLADLEILKEYLYEELSNVLEVIKLKQV